MAESITDDYIKRALRVNRVAVGEGAKSAAVLNKAHDKIRSLMSKLTPDSTPAEVANTQKAITAILAKTYSTKLVPKAAKDAATMVKAEMKWNAATIGSYTTLQVAVPELQAGLALAKSTPYQGKTFETWFRQAGAKEISKINNALAAGLISGQDTGSVARTVAGVMKTSTRDVQTLTRSALLQASALSRSVVINANKDLMNGKRWVSTLDINTTADICGIRDQLKYDMNNEPVDHDLPWEDGPGAIHFNCRSVEAPWMKGEKQAGERPSVGAGENYSRGDNKTRTGKTRRLSKKEIEKGIYDTEVKTTATKYEGWLRTQPTEFVADALGSADKATAFKGGTSLRAVTSTPLGSPLNIGDL